MSERAYFLIPADPFYLPDENQQKLFLEFFKAVSPFPNAYGDYYCYVYEQPEPVDAGEAFEGLVCPKCGSMTRLFDDNGQPLYHTWWSDALKMPRAAEIQMPSCGCKVRVADMRFYELGGFARFVVGTVEPSDSDFWEDEGRPYGFLKSETVQRFEEILGCGVLQVWDYR